MNDNDNDIEYQYNGLKLMLAAAVDDIKKACREIRDNATAEEWGRKMGLAYALSTLSCSLWLLGINEELGLDFDPAKEIFGLNLDDSNDDQDKDKDKDKE